MGTKTVARKIEGITRDKVNTILKCVRFDYIESAYAPVAFSLLDKGVVVLNTSGVDIFSIKNDFSYKDLYRFLLYTIVHEFSHLDQEVNIIRYAKDKMYKMWIEKTNYLNSLEWIVNNEDYIRKNMYSDFDFGSIPDTYRKLKLENLTYIKSTNSSLVARSIDMLLYMDKSRYVDYDVIELLIADENKIVPDRVIVKMGRSVIDCNALYPIVNSLRSSIKHRLVYNHIENRKIELQFILKNDNETKIITSIN